MMVIDRLRVNSNSIGIRIGTTIDDGEGADILWTLDSSRFKAMLNAALL